MLNPPTDPDNDVIIENQNEDGKVDNEDIGLFFDHIDWIQENEPISPFDFNGNDRRDFADVNLLLNEI